jgi:hypothetical protein
MPTARRAVTLLLCGAVVLALCGGPPARSEHFDMVLMLRGSRGTAEAHWDTSPPAGGVNRREVLSVAPGEDLTLDWSLRSEFPHGVMKRVTVRTFVAPIEATGRKQVPPDDAPRVLDNSFRADFLPRHSARGVLHFRLTQPGSYLLQMESEETQKEHDHEHFAALEINVELPAEHAE